MPGDEQSAVSQLGEAIAEVEALGLPCSVQMRVGLTPALEAEAKRLGFDSARVGARDGRDGRRPAGPRRYGDCKSHGSTAPTNLEEAHALAAAGFEAPADLFAPFFTSKVAAMPGLSIYVARAEGTPVSTATSLVQGDAVGIFNVATPPQHRRSGYAIGGHDPSGQGRPRVRRDLRLAAVDPRSSVRLPADRLPASRHLHAPQPPTRRSGSIGPVVGGGKGLESSGCEGLQDSARSDSRARVRARRLAGLPGEVP